MSTGKRRAAAVDVVARLEGVRAELEELAGVAPAAGELEADLRAAAAFVARAQDRRRWRGSSVRLLSPAARGES